MWLMLDAELQGKATRCLLFEMNEHLRLRGRCFYLPSTLAKLLPKMVGVVT